MKATRPTRPLRRGWLGLVATALLGIFVALLHLTGNPTLERVEGVTLDWRFLLRGQIAAPDSVAIIAIDDRSLAALGRPPVPRSKLAEAVDKLQVLGARTVALDILLLGPESAGPAGDLKLAASLGRHGHGVLAMAMLFDDAATAAPAGNVMGLALPVIIQPTTGVLQPPRAVGLLRPQPDIEHAALVGHVNLLPDAGGTPRAHYPVIKLSDSYLPSFPLLAAAGQPSTIAISLAGKLNLLGGPNVPRRQIDLGRQLELPLNYLGPEGTAPTFSMIDLMEDRVPAENLRGRVVLIGQTATGSGDSWPTPFGPSLPGVEVLATATANLLDDTYLSRSVPQILIESVLIVILALAAWALGQAPGPRLGLLLNLSLLVVWIVLAHLLLVYGLRWVAIAGPGLGILLGATIAVIGHMVRERRLRGEVERQRGNLARYVPPSLADALADKEAAAFDGREQMAAILFVDLQGFTHASESRSPTETAHFLKSFHAQLEAVVSDHGGIIAQFLGDGAFAMWGLPQPTPQDPVSALACARDMLRRLHAWQPEMTARIGVHFGPVAMAQLGGQNQLQLTAAGDTVNVASRLEAIAKEVSGVLVISDDLAGTIRVLGRHDLLAGLAAQPARRVRGRDQLLGYWSARKVADLA